MPASPRLLIVTAAFGEGHNSAARNLGLALTQAGAEVKVCDPCMLAAPHSTRLIERVYRYITTHFPKVWERIYRSTDKSDFNKQSLPLMRKPERYLTNLIEDFKPDAIVSTYPVYPYFIARTFRQYGGQVPVFTVVTDSLEVNATWLRAPTDHWIVTDPATKEVMTAAPASLPPEKIEVTGFPVHPDFAEIPPVGNSDCCDPFKILYFPTGKKPFIRRHSRALLDAHPSVHLTIVMGKYVSLLLPRALQIRREYPGRVKLVGWTRRVTKLLNRHHLVVGKAGGATVHEAIAAHCPMLIHHLVPGQEEGNLRLLESIGCGKLAETPEHLTSAVACMLERDAAGWRTMKRSVTRHDRNSGSITAARFILGRLSAKDTP
jgi:processive 1,2-diacylglycerol beta-glucosyltransferase